MKIVVTLIRKGWVVVSQGDVTVHVRGQAHLGDEYLNTEALAERILAVALQVSNLPPLVSALNGNWATVVNTSSSAFLAVDHVRSIQLLYSQEGEDFYVFDDVNDFRKEHKLEIDEDCAHEYLSSGYVYRNRTLFKDVHSLQAAEYVIASPIKASKPLTLQTTSTRYWRYVPNICKPVKTGPELVKKIDEVFMASMRRLIESVGDKRIVIPLSGGYDSRLIVNYLYKLGHKNVLCYTYGRKGNGESRCSKLVAENLGYEWHFVEYTDEEFSKILDDPLMDGYYRYMCNGVNRPCFQEYLALRTLKEAGVIDPERDVVVPGYYFDILAGSHVAPWIMNFTAVSEVCEWENNFFPRTHFWKTMKAIGDVFRDHADIPARQFVEGWSWQERLSKFIVNNIRSYESLGFCWRLSLCDRALFDLWLSIPYSLRVERSYFYSVFAEIVVPAIRECPVHGQSSRSFVKRIRHWVGVRVPYVVEYGFDLMKGCGKKSVQHNRELVSRVSCVVPSAKIRLGNAFSENLNATISLKSLSLMC